MTTGFKVGTKDLDDVFDPYVVGTKPALTGFRAGSQDLRDRYAPLVYGTKAAATAFRIGSGADLNTLFAAKGSAVYEHVIEDPGYAPLSSIIGSQTGPADVWAEATLTLFRNGTWTMAPASSLGAGITKSGDWFDPPRATAGDAYQVRFTPSLTHNDGAAITNTASNWTALGSGQVIDAKISGSHGDNKTVTGTVRVQIRRTSDGVVLSDVSVALNVGLNAFG